ncbi:MAG: PilZ domain-containing protein [Pseudomonadota bacterium]
MGAEQRRYTRKTLSAMIKITLPDGGIVNAVGLDISSDGIGFISVAQLFPNKFYTVDFDIVLYSKKEHISAVVQVVHSAFNEKKIGYRIGVQFKEITEEALSFVSVFLR